MCMYACNSHEYNYYRLTFYWPKNEQHHHENGCYEIYHKTDMYITSDGL